MSERSLISRRAAPKPRRAGPRTREEAARRTQILEAAARVFARRGFDAARVSEIARTAGLSEGSIYNYFRSKEDLLVQIPQHFVRPVLTPIASAPAPRNEAEMEALLLAMAQAVVVRVRAQAPFMKVFLSALPRLSLSARRQFMQLLPIHGADVLEAFLREGMRRGLVRSDLDPVIAARVLPGMLLLFLMTQEVLLGRPIIPRGYDAIVAEAVRIFLHGTTSRGRRSAGESPPGG